MTVSHIKKHALGMAASQVINFSYASRNAVSDENGAPSQYNSYQRMLAEIGNGKHSAEWSLREPFKYRGMPDIVDYIENSAKEIEVHLSELLRATAYGQGPDC